VQKAGSVDRAGLHLGWDGYEGSWYSLALANGGRYYNQALDQCTIAGPACVKALDYAAAMAKTGGNATPRLVEDGHRRVQECGGRVHRRQGLDALRRERDLHGACAGEDRHRLGRHLPPLRSHHRDRPATGRTWPAW